MTHVAAPSSIEYPFVFVSGVECGIISSEYDKGCWPTLVQIKATLASMLITRHTAARMNKSYALRDSDLNILFVAVSFKPARSTHLSRVSACIGHRNEQKGAGEKFFWDLFYDIFYFTHLAGTDVPFIGSEISIIDTLPCTSCSHEETCLIWIMRVASTLKSIAFFNLYLTFFLEFRRWNRNPWKLSDIKYHDTCRKLPICHHLYY